MASVDGIVLCRLARSCPIMHRMLDLSVPKSHVNRGHPPFRLSAPSGQKESRLYYHGALPELLRPDVCGSADTLSIRRRLALRNVGTNCPCARASFRYEQPYAARLCRLSGCCILAHYYRTSSICMSVKAGKPAR